MASPADIQAILKTLSLEEKVRNSHIESAFTVRGDADHSRSPFSRGTRFLQLRRFHRKMSHRLG